MSSGADWRKRLYVIIFRHETPAGKAFDVALLDLDLPGMDGLSLAAALRARGFRGPLVAVTARADAAAEPQARAAGFRRVLRKPVTGAMLAEALLAGVDGVDEDGDVPGVHVR